MNKKEALDVLGLSGDPSTSEIKKAYRKASSKAHPDKGGSDEQMSKINQARDVLEKGESIDAHYSHSYGSNDEINEFFRQREEAHRRARASGPDFRTSISISLQEAYDGCTKKISVPNMKAISVGIPEGVVHGQSIILRGKGGKRKSEEGVDGDLYVFVLISDHESIDLHENGTTSSVVSLSLEDAMAGVKIPVRTLAGSVIVTIPKATQSGTTLRIPKHGSKVRCRFTGQVTKQDHHIICEVRIPTLEEFHKKWRAIDDELEKDLQELESSQHSGPSGDGDS